MVWHVRDKHFKFHKVVLEVLFEWGGNSLHDFVANLFTKLCIKFHQNRPSFIEDIMRNILVSFFPNTLYVQRYCIICNRYKQTYNIQEKDIVPPVYTAGKGIEIIIRRRSNISILIFMTLKGGEKMKTNKDRLDILCQLIKPQTYNKVTRIHNRTHPSNIRPTA